MSNEQHQQALLLLAQLTVCAAGSRVPPCVSPAGQGAGAAGLQASDAAGFQGLTRDVASLRGLVRKLRESPSLSLYQVALAGGLEKYLQSFVAAVASLEGDFLSDPALTPHHARYGLKAYFAAVPVLLRLTQDTVDRNAQGGAVLDALHAAATCGDEDVRAACDQLLAHVRRPFLAQIAHWLAFATLDVGDDITLAAGSSAGSGGCIDGDLPWDFFVTPPKLRAGGSGKPSGGMSSGHSEKSSLETTLLESSAWSPQAVEQFYTIAASVSEEEEDDQAALFPGLAAGHSTDAAAGPLLRGPLVPASDPMLGAGVQDAAGRTAHAACLADAAIGDARATYDRSRVPLSHLSQELAYSIYSIGSAVSLLASPDVASSSSSHAAPSRFAGDDPDLADFDAAGEEDADLGGGGDGAAASPWRFGPKESIFVTRLFSSLRHGGSGYSPLALQCVVDRVKALVHKRLWRLLIEGAGLDAHLLSLRSYALMGRADLFQSFLERLPAVTSHMPATSSSSLAQITNGPWAAAALSTGIQGDGDRADTRLAALVERLGALAPDEDEDEEEYEEEGFGGMEDDEGESWRGGSPGKRKRQEQGGAGRPRGGGAPGDPTFRLVRWVLRQKALRWEAPEPIPLKPPTAAPAPAPAAVLGASASITAAVLKHWAPVGEGRDASAAAGLLRAPRAQATVALAGAASPAAVPVLRLSPSPTPAVEQLLYVGGPPSLAPRAPSVSHAAPPSPRVARAGAVWLAQPPVVARGFMARACVTLDVPSALPPPAHDLVLAGVYEPHTAAVAVQLAQTTSFALVLARGSGGSTAAGRDVDPLPRPAGTASRRSATVLASFYAAHGSGGAEDEFALWRPAAASAPGGAPAPPPPRVSSVPTAGFDGLDSSLVVHVMCRRNHESDPHTAASASLRVVVAVFGPPAADADAVASAASGTRADGRKLLASGVIPELSVPVLGRYTAAPGDGQHERSLLGLSLALEYTGAGAGEAEPRLRVAVLELPPAASGADTRRSSTVSVTSAGGAGTAAALLGGAQTRTVVDSPLSLPSVLNLVGAWKGPGRDRALLGVTADTGSPLLQPGPSRGFLSPSGVAVSALDAVSYSDTDEGYSGLCLTYAPPPPLALVLPSPALATYQDVFGLVFATRTAAFKLQRSWVDLMSSFSTDTGTRTGGGGGGVVGATSVAQRRQPSRAGGDRLQRGRRGSTSGGTAEGDGPARDKWNPAVAAARRSRIAIHALLKPVWALRHRMAAVADALVYYLQVDVIEAAYAALAVSAGLASSPALGAPGASSSRRSFSSLHAAHQTFLARLLAGSFFTNSVMLACIHRILGHCTRFADFVSTYAAGGGSVPGPKAGLSGGARGAAPAAASTAAALPALLHPERGRPVFLEIANGFESDMRLLVGALASVAGSAALEGGAGDAAAHHAAAPQSLLLRLNFNGHFAGL